jgi:hypothetical protein
MTKDIYKSAKGKPVDMGALRLKNEQTVAVGNMKVNARGDKIDEQGQIIASKPAQVNEQYNQQLADKMTSHTWNLEG